MNRSCIGLLSRTLRVGATVALLALVIGIAASPSEAAVITYVTPSGSMWDTHPVSASATITTGAGTVSVLLENLQANPRATGENLSDLLLTFSNDVGTSSLTSSSGQEITVASDGSFTPGAVVPTGWALDSPTANQLYLDVLGTSTAPKHTIIGPPGGPTYSNANSSIAGNGPHNPFLNQSATFIISAAGVTANTLVTGAVFSFGTTPGNDITGVPEPSTFLLSGIGLGMLGLWQVVRRRSKSV